MYEFLIFAYPFTEIPVTAVPSSYFTSISFTAATNTQFIKHGNCQFLVTDLTVFKKINNENMSLFIITRDDRTAYKPTKALKVLMPRCMYNTGWLLLYTDVE